MNGKNSSAPEKIDGKSKYVETGIVVNGKEVVLPNDIKEEIDNVLREIGDDISKKGALLSIVSNPGLMSIFKSFFRNDLQKLFSLLSEINHEDRRNAINYINNFDAHTDFTSKTSDEIATVVSQSSLVVLEKRNKEIGITHLHMGPDCFQNNYLLTKNYRNFYDENLAPLLEKQYVACILPTFHNDDNSKCKENVGEFLDLVCDTYQGLFQSPLSTKSYGSAMFYSFFTPGYFGKGINQHSSWQDLENNLSDPHILNKFKKRLYNFVTKTNEYDILDDNIAFNYEHDQKIKGIFDYIMHYLKEFVANWKFYYESGKEGGEKKFPDNSGWTTHFSKDNSDKQTYQHIFLIPVIPQES